MTDLSINVDLLPYCGQLATRPLAAIELLVIHCTELPDLVMAREYGERVLYPDSGTGNSGHYYIDRDGSIQQWVSDDRVAHHVVGHNQNSIGIELVNRGRYPNWLDSRHQMMSQLYPFTQLNSLVALVAHLQENLPGLTRVAGHDALDRGKVPASDNPELEVFRKHDPGPLFPWDEFLDSTALERWSPE